MGIVDFAKRFAEAGMYVFPLYNTSAGPQKPYGWALNKVKDDVDPAKIIQATISIDVIEAWEATIASAYKSTIHSFGVLGKGLVIIDIDIKNNQKGDLSYELLKKTYNLPTANLIVKSKSGGIHLYFAKSQKYIAAQIKTVSGLVMAQIKYTGVDIRGDGGMVIGPTSDGAWVEGTYTIIKGAPNSKLSELPDIFTAGLLKSASFSDVDAMIDYNPEEHSKDVMDILKRGEIPPKLEAGQRNEGFYIFIHALKNKGLARATVRALCENLKEVTDDLDTLSESVNVDDMINRAFSVDPNNPYDISRDVIEFGFYQLMAYRNKLNYILPNPNPYIPSKNVHDESSMKTLFLRHAREMTVGEKKRVVNPIDVIIKILPDTHKVDTIGFKPGSGDVYYNGEDSHSKSYLNTYLAPFIPKTPIGLNTDIYRDFCILISRIFGEEGSEEYQLGLDFTAWMLQYPENKCVIAPYIMSEHRGVGKSLYFNLLAKIYGNSKVGDRQAHMVKIEEITGRFFNPAGRLLNMLDEIQFPVHKDMRRESSTFWRHLKNLITAETVPVEVKGGDTYQMPNTAAYILAGNTGSNFPMEEYDRRIWIINNAPPIMTRGTVDSLYDLAKGNYSAEKSRNLVHSLRYHLQHHQIQLGLDSIRAPMNELKRELMLNSMTNEDEWFYTHFENPENLLATTPIMSKSALLYLFDMSEQLQKSRWQNDAEGLFRDFKRKGFIRPIRTQRNLSASRQFSSANQVSPLGEITGGPVKDILYTTRFHGSLDQTDSDEIIKLYNRNLHSIRLWKDELAKTRKSGGGAPHNSIDVSSL